MAGGARASYIECTRLPAQASGSALMEPVAKTPSLIFPGTVQRPSSRMTSNESERVRKVTAERAADDPRKNSSLHDAAPIADNLEPPMPCRSDAAYAARAIWGVIFDWAGRYRSSAWRFSIIGLAAPYLRSIRKSSSFLPDRSCATSQRGCFPRPAHVSLRFFGLRYFGTTFG